MRTFKIYTVVLFTIAASAAISKADLPDFPICLYDYDQITPAVSGSSVVWTDKSNALGYGYDIYSNKNPADMNGTPICAAVRNQINPAISGNTVVWQDYRPSTTNCDIYKYLMPSGPETSICTLTSKQESPAVSGNTIVWVDNRNANNDILGYDGTNLTICTDTLAQDSPAIDGRIVVWRDMRNVDADIYGKDLQTSADIVIRIAGSDQQNPAISGNIVVWQDNRNGDNDIYGKNLSGGEIEICIYAGSEQKNAAISGDIVVWEDYRNGNADIYGYRISTHTEFPICTLGSHQKNPAISGNFVVWEDYRNGSADIYGANIPEPAIITVLSPNGGEMLLAGSEHTIMWQTSGQPVSYVRLEDSNDNGLTFSIIDANVINTGSYVWKLPAEDSNKCLVRITDKDNPASGGISSNVFTIFKCDATLTADLSGDCKVDFMDFALFNEQWLERGNPYDPKWPY